MATERYRLNVISTFLLPHWHIVEDHDQLGVVAWSCYKNRMGTSVGISMAFQLDSILYTVDDLGHLALPFTTDEIDEVCGMYRRCVRILVVLVAASTILLFSVLLFETLT